MHTNTSFSQKLPTLQIYVDASSLTEFKICPRRYYYSIVMGRQPQAESIHLTFGILLHKAAELYHIRRFTKQEAHTEALREVVRWLMVATWDREANRPWTSNDKYKNRFTLVRTVVWYLDKYQEDELRTAILKDGRPAVELPFTMDAGYDAFTGEGFMLCGKLDRIVTFKTDYYVSDIKTTQSTIGDYYFKKYTPDNQVTIYNIAGNVSFGLPVQGLIIDGCQIAIEFSRFERGLIERTEAQMLEWQEELGYWLMNMNTCAEQGHWPKNDSACNMYGGCPFRPVCSQPNPTAAQKVIEGAYRERSWDPLKNRTSFHS
jgi:PD-(D/E)XK nuclease superfamily